MGVSKEIGMLQLCIIGVDICIPELAHTKNIFIDSVNQRK
jgi:hypothetical protein